MFGCGEHGGGVVTYGVDDGLFLVGCVSEGFELADDGGADDDAVCNSAEHVDLFGLPDSEADGEGEVGFLVEPLELIFEFWWEVVSDSGDACDGDAVDESTGCGENFFDAVGCGGG